MPKNAQSSGQIMERIYTLLLNIWPQLWRNDSFIMAICFYTTNILFIDFLLNKYFDWSNGLFIYYQYASMNIIKVFIS